MRVLPTAGSGDAVVGDSTPTEEPQASGTGKDGKASTPKKSVLRIPNTAIAGAVAMKTPSVYEANILYKIGTTVTLEWNYTHLIVTPAAINIVAFCKDAARDFTIAGNVSGGVTRILWDTEAQYKTDIFPV